MLFDMTVPAPADVQAANALARLLCPTPDVRKTAREFLVGRETEADRLVANLPASVSKARLAAHRDQLVAKLDDASFARVAAEQRHEAALLDGDAKTAAAASKALRSGAVELEAIRGELATVDRLLGECDQSIGTAAATIRRKSRADSAEAGRLMREAAVAELAALLRTNEAFVEHALSFAVGTLLIDLDRDVIHGKSGTLLDRLASIEDRDRPRPPRVKPKPYVPPAAPGPNASIPTLR